MRAVVQARYGSPEEALRVADVDRPDLAADVVLVEVHAASVTRGDAMGVLSETYRFTRVFTGLRRPRRPVIGTEFAGRVVEVGETVTRFAVGDEVFGVRSGSNAEYVAVRGDGAIAPKPAGLTWEGAAALPDGSLLALTCLRPGLPLEGKRVLVYGAAGSIGTAAVQLLVHHFGAEVTAVCDTEDVELVRSLGAPVVLDRLKDDFTRNGERYDVIFDAVGKHSFRRSRRSLEPRGIYISLDLGYGYHLPFLALATKVAGRRRATFGFGRYLRDDLLLVAGLAEAGKYRPVIDRTYALDDVVEAVRYVATGQKTGNVVLRIREAAAAT